MVLLFNRTCSVHYRSSPPEVFLGNVVLQIRGKFTGEHPCQSAISIKLQINFIEVTLRHGCSPVNLLRILGNLILKTPLTGYFSNYAVFRYESLNSTCMLDLLSIDWLLNDGNLLPSFSLMS